MMFNTLNTAIEGYFVNIARISEDFKHGKYKDAKGYKVALSEEYTKIYSLLVEVALYDATTWNEYDEWSDRFYDYTVKTFTGTIS